MQPGQQPAPERAIDHVLGEPALQQHSAGDDAMPRRGQPAEQRGERLARAGESRLMHGEAERLMSAGESRLMHGGASRPLWTGDPPAAAICEPLSGASWRAERRGVCGACIGPVLRRRPGSLKPGPGVGIGLRVEASVSGLEASRVHRSSSIRRGSSMVGRDVQLHRSGKPHGSVMEAAPSIGRVARRDTFASLVDCGVQGDQPRRCRFRKAPQRCRSEVACQVLGCWCGRVDGCRLRGVASSALWAAFSTRRRPAAQSWRVVGSLASADSRVERRSGSRLAPPLHLPVRHRRRRRASPPPRAATGGPQSWLRPSSGPPAPSSAPVRA